MCDVWGWGKGLSPGLGLEESWQGTQSLHQLSGHESHWLLLRGPEWMDPSTREPAFDSAASTASVRCAAGPGPWWWPQSWHSSVAGPQVSHSLLLWRTEAE